MIEVNNLVKYYGSHLAVDRLSFQIGACQAFGFLGPNGAGKSTTLNMLTGCLSASEGSIRICGKDILSQAKEAKRHIGYLPEIPPVYPEMTPLEYLSFIAEARGIRRPQRREAVQWAVERTGLGPVSRRLIRSLSKGYRQRVGFAQALVGRPDVIILDEPTVGLDPQQIMEFRSIIQELKQSHTVIFSSHILSEVEAVCDQIMVIAHGRLAALDAPDRLAAHMKNGQSIRVLLAEQEVSKALEALDRRGIPALRQPEAGGLAHLLIRTTAEPEAPARVSSILEEAGCRTFELQCERASLEEIFLALVEERQPEDGGDGQ